MSDDAKYLIRVKGGRVTAVRERIERVLGVATDVVPEPYGGWSIYFDAPRDIDLDFLRPDVLPPSTGGGGPR